MNSICIHWTPTPHHPRFLRNFYVIDHNGPIFFLTLLTHKRKGGPHWRVPHNHTKQSNTQWCYSTHRLFNTARMCRPLPQSCTMRWRKENGWATHDLLKVTGWVQTKDAVPVIPPSTRSYPNENKIKSIIFPRMQLVNLEGLLRKLWVRVFPMPRVQIERQKKRLFTKDKNVLCASIPPILQS